MKIAKILIINLLCIFNIIIFFDWVLYAKDYYKVQEMTDDFKFSLKQGSDRFTLDLPYNENLKSIFIFGCSYAYGWYLSEHETFAYKLQELTKRKVYNFSLPAAGIQHMLYQLQYSDLFKENNNLLLPPPEYYIYFFIPDHLRRMNVNFFDDYEYEKYTHYKVKNGKLELCDEHVHWIDYIKVTLLYKKINSLIYKFSSDDKKFDLLKMYLLEMKKILDSKYSDTKFAIVIYNSKYGWENYPDFHTTRWKELEQEGFIIINLDSEKYKYLHSKKYLAKDNVHPGEEFWNILTPLIAKKLQLY